MHPQTVRYRLKQLRELFGDRLEDPEARFELALALRAARDGATLPCAPCAFSSRGPRACWAGRRRRRRARRARRRRARPRATSTSPTPTPSAPRSPTRAPTRSSTARPGPTSTAPRPHEARRHARSTATAPATSPPPPRRRARRPRLHRLRLRRHARPSRTPRPTRPARSAPTGAPSSPASAPSPRPRRRTRSSAPPGCSAPHGKNFVDTMLRLGRRARRGRRGRRPGRLPDLHRPPRARARRRSPSARLTGVLHVAGGGRCSWYELAQATFEEAGAGCARRTRARTAEFAAPRAAPGVLRARAPRAPDAPVLPPWRDGLADYLELGGPRSEAARLRRSRLHRLELRPPAHHRARRRGRRARQAHLRRPRGEPRRRPDAPASASSAAGSRTPTPSRDAMEGRDAVVNFAAETHVDRSIAEPDAFVTTHALGTYVLLEAAARARRCATSRSRPTRSTARSTTGSFTEESPLAPVLALLGHQGGRRPARVRPTSTPTGCRR